MCCVVSLCDDFSSSFTLTGKITRWADVSIEQYQIIKYYKEWNCVEKSVAALDQRFNI